MIFVSQNTKSIPIPNALAYYTFGPMDRDIDDYGSLFDTYIFMYLVDGQTLDQVWESHCGDTKTRIASQLRTYLEEFRGIGDGSYIDAIDNSPVTDQMLSNYHNKGPYTNQVFWIVRGQVTDACTVQGPFETEEQFHK